MDLHVLRFSRIALVFALLVSISCAQAKPIPSDSEVFVWAQNNLEAAFSQTNRIKPEFFDLALIPDDFNYGKTPEDYSEVRPSREISDVEAGFLRDVGIVSALADYCELPYEERNFFPMMQWQRARLPKAERNGYYIYRLGVSHGYAMGMTDKILKHWTVDCDRLKIDLEEKLFADIFSSYDKTR